MKKLFSLDRVHLETAVVDTTAAVGDVEGAEFDTQNYNQGIILFDLAVTTDQTDYVIKMQHRDETGDDWEDVDTDVVPEVDGSVTDDKAQEVFEVPFKSLKRYVRAVATLSENAADHVVMVYAAGDRDYMPSDSDFLDN